MVKFPEAEARRFHGVFVCKRCKARVRSTALKIASGRISCKRCGGSAFRPVRKK